MITLTHETAQRRLILRSITRSARGMGNLPVLMRYNRVPGGSGFAIASKAFFGRHRPWDRTARSPRQTIPERDLIHLAKEPFAGVYLHSEPEKLSAP